MARRNPLSYLLDPSQEDELLDGEGGATLAPPIELDQVDIEADPLPPQEPVTEEVSPPVPSPPPPVPRRVEQPPSTEQADPRAALEKRLIEQSLTSGQESVQTQTDPRLESTKPAWYNSIAPPRQKSQMGGDIVKTVLGAMLAPSRKEKRYALIGGLGGMVDHLRTKDTDQATADLDAATKQANMYRTLNPVSRSSKGKDGSPLGALNYFLGQERFTAAQEKDKRTQEQLKNEADPTSKVSMDAKKGLVSSGAATFDQVKDLSYKQIKEDRARFGQSAQFERTAEDFDRRLQNRSLVHQGQEERAQEYGVAKEARAQEQRDLEAYIPGRGGEGWHAPDRAAVEKAKAAKTAGETITAGAARLKEIQAKLEEANQLAGMGGMIEQYIGTDEQKALLTEAQTIQQDMGTSQRVLANMGVPQQFEMALVNSINPQAGSIKGFFKGPFAWDALHNYYKEKTDRTLTDLGYPDENAPRRGPKLSTDDPSNALPKFEKPAPRPYQRRGGQAPTPLDLPGTAPIGSSSSSSSSSGTIGVFQVQLPSGNTSTRPLTQKQYDALKAIGTPLTPVQTE